VIEQAKDNIGERVAALQQLGSLFGKVFSVLQVFQLSYYLKT